MDFSARSVLSGLEHPLLIWPFTFCVFASTFTYALSVLSANSGTIDRLWALLPATYSVYFALLPLWPSDADVPRIYNFTLVPNTPSGVEIWKTFSPQALMMLLLIMLWMIRLNYNAWRRGLFDPRNEDYRWEVIRAGMSPFTWQIFNFVWIAFLQNLLLLSITLPIYHVVSSPRRSPSPTDYVLFVSALITTMIEFTADNQQWTYQEFKRLYRTIGPEADPDKLVVAAEIHSRLPRSTHWPFARLPFTPADASRGFVTRGLWAWSRHPNFLSEQAFWFLIALFPLLSDDRSASALGILLPALLQTLMFVSSTTLTESISRSKYPAYAAYQQRVGVWAPMPWGWVMGAEKRRKCERALWGEGDKEE